MNDINEFESARENNLIDYLRSAISDGVAGMLDAPSLLRQIIENELWRERFVRQTKEIARFDTFDQFIAAAPPEGLNVSKRLLYKLCADDIALLDLLDSTFKGNDRGGDRRSDQFKSNNVTIEKPARGNSAVYSLRRLRTARPDLHKRVLEKEISINRAMIKAGLRKNTFAVAADVSKICSAIKEKFTPDQIAEIIEQLQSEQYKGQDPAATKLFR